MREILSLVVTTFGADDEMAEPELVSWQDLPFATHLRAQFIEALSEFGYSLHREGRELDPTARELGSTVQNALEDAAFDDVLVVHVLSHGYVDEQTDKLRVIGADGRHTGRTEVERWLTDVEGRRDGTGAKDAPYALFLLDLCHAGKAARLGWQLSVPDEQRRAWVLAATTPDAPAFDGRFTRAIVATLRSAARGTLDAALGLPFIPVELIAQEIRQQTELLGVGLFQQRVIGNGMDIASRSIALPFFPNPAYDPVAAARLSRRSAIDAILRPYLDQFDDLLDWRHFIARAGAEATVDSASLFRGRTDELSRLSPWLDGAGPGALAVVTGGPGTGKSTLLGVLVCAAHPALADATEVPMAGVRGDLPARNPHLAAVHARDRQATEMLSSVGSQLCLTEPAEGWAAGLAAAVATVPGNPVVVLDALDEARNPLAVLSELVIPLSNARRPDGSAACRLLVGVRPWLEFDGLVAEAAAEGLLVDLDDSPRDALREDLRTFVADVLRRGGYGPADLRTARDAIASVVAETLVDKPVRAGEPRWGEFLVAQLFTGYLTQLEPVSDAVAAVELACTVPVTVPGVFELDMEARAPSSPWLRPVLAAVAHSHGAGMPRRILRSVVGLFADQRAHAPTPSAEDLGQALEQGRRYLRTDVDADGSVVYRLFHHTLADYLKTRPSGAGDDRRMLVTELLDSLLASLPRDDFGNRSWSEADSYLREHAAAHALDADRLDELLTDPEYLVHGSPTATAVVLSQATSEAAIANAAVFRRSQSLLTDLGTGERRQLLMVEAFRHDHDEFARQLVGADVPPSALRPSWVTGTDTAGVLRTVIRASRGRVTASTCGELDGLKVGLTGDSEGLVRIWDLATGRLVREFDVSSSGRGQEVTSVGLVHWTGQPVVLVTACGLTVALRDACTGELLREIPTANTALACGWEYNGIPVLLVGDSHGSLFLVGLYGAPPTQVTAHGDGRIGDDITGIATSTWDQDLPVVLTSGHDPGVRMSALYNGTAMSSLDGWVDDVAVVDVDGHPVAVTVESYGSRAWDLDRNTVISTYPGLRGYGGSAAACRLGNRPVAVTTSYERAVHVWDVRSGETVAVLAGHSDDLRTVSAYSDSTGCVVLTGCDDGIVRIFDVEAVAEPVAGHTLEVRAVAWREIDGRLLVISGGVDGRVWMWDARSGRPFGTFAGPERIYALAVGTADGATFAVMGGPQAELRISHLPSGAGRLVLQVGQNQLAALDDPRAGQQVRGVAVADLQGQAAAVAGGLDGCGTVWDVRDGTLLGRYELHDRPINAVATLVLDGIPGAISAGWDGRAVVWDLADGQVRSVLNHGAAGLTAVATIEADGRTLVATGAVDALRVWDPRGGGALLAHLGESNRVDALACGELDGTQIAVAAHGRRVDVWNIHGMTMRERLILPHPVRALAVARDGYIAIGFGSDVGVWPRGAR